MALSQLQNGSDIRGIAISTTDNLANLQEKEVVDIAKGFLNFLLLKPDLLTKWQNKQLLVGVGRDSRISGPSLTEAFIKTLTQLGVNVINFNLATTPSMFMATQYDHIKVDASAMFTASHLPFYYNGIKFFTQLGGLEHDDIHYILSNTSVRHSTHYKGQVKEIDLIPLYSQDIIEKIRQGSNLDTPTPLEGMHIIVDAGNGAGGFFKDILEALGAKTDGSQFLDPDGTFPNHIPNPDDKVAMASIQEAVLKNKADLGIIFDTDVDRGAVVTKKGEILNRNNLIAILSYITLSDYPETAIVTNSLTSYHVSNYIRSLGGKHIRHISGYRNVINRAILANQEGIDCQLAVEASGHAAFKENYFLDDGMYVAAKILMLLPQLKADRKDLDSLISQLKQPVETYEARLKIETDSFRNYGFNVLKDLEKLSIPGFTLDQENEEGVRFKLSAPFGEGWFLLRLSLHEPLLVLTFENDQKGYIDSLVQILSQFLTAYPKINQAPFTHHLENS